MNQTDPARSPASRHAARSALTVRSIGFGLLVLLAGAAGAYSYLLRSSGTANETATGAGSVFRTHATPRALPALAFEDEGGRKRTLDEYRGRILLLNLWATWCGPCREEMPSLDRLQRKLAGASFEVVALSIDAGGAAAVRRFYDEIGIRALSVFVDPSTRAAASLGIVGIPATLLIDREGREIGRRVGPAQWDGPEAVRSISGYLAASANP